jgi:hypothetical protein
VLFVLITVLTNSIIVSISCFPLTCFHGAAVSTKAGIPLSVQRLKDRSIRVRFPVGVIDFFFSSPNCLFPYVMGTRNNLCCGKAVGVVKLTTNLYLIPGIRMNGAMF